MEDFKSIIEHIKHSRSIAIAAVNSELINLNWQIGQWIHWKLNQSDWGDKTVSNLADYIKVNHPDIKGFEKRNLYRMVQFFETYSKFDFVSAVPTLSNKVIDQSIVSAVPTQLKNLQLQDISNTWLTKLSWTHHCIIMSRCSIDEERFFYIKHSIDEKLSSRQLERQISAGVFERTMIGNVNVSPALHEIHTDISNTFRDNYVLDFLNLKPDFKERDLQSALVSQMKDFILELGSDYLFVGQEYKLMVGNSDFYIDLLFFHRQLQCLIAFELKADKFKPEQLGQLNFYLEALDRDVKKEHENPSIGILLCKDKDQEVVEYALSRSLSPTMVSQYQLNLPDKKVLQEKLHELFDL